MDSGVMVHKANSIARFFAAYPPEEAVAGVAKHLQMFWEPRMRRQLQEYVAADGAGLHELVLEATRFLAPSAQAPTAAESAANSRSTSSGVL